MCVCVRARVWMCRCACLCINLWRSEFNFWLSSSIAPLPSLFFLGEVSLWIWISSFQLNCLISDPLGWVCLYLTCSHTKSVGLQAHASTPSFYEGIENLNTGLCSCPVSTIPKETLPQIQDFLKKHKLYWNIIGYHLMSHPLMVQSLGFWQTHMVKPAPSWSLEIPQPKDTVTLEHNPPLHNCWPVSCLCRLWASFFYNWTSVSPYSKGGALALWILKPLLKLPYFEHAEDL